jgi:hypothetical protein
MLNNRVRLPYALVWALLPAAISLALLSTVSLVLSIVLGPSSDFNFLQWLPQPLALVVIVWGVYTGIGSVALWFAMWIYWGTMERSSLSSRVGWFCALLFGMHYAALIYAFNIWKKGILRVVTDAPPRVRSGAPPVKR